MRWLERKAGSTPALPRTAATRVLGLMVVACLGVAVIFPSLAFATGPDAIIKPAGYDANLVPRGDDTSNLIVNLPFSMNWNGTSYTQIYINMNGNCTFGQTFTGYNPNDSTLAATNRNIMAPLWCDVDTRNTTTGQVTYSSLDPGSIPQYQGHDAFIVNWIGVASYNQQSAPLDEFQLVIVDRSDTGAGNFDFIFNYDQVAWDIANSASSRRARAGWGRAGAGFELPGSGTAQNSASALMDSAPAATALIRNYINNEGQLGRYVFQVRGGAAPNTPPVIQYADRTLEGNAPWAYTDFTGADEATATDADGTVSTFVNTLPFPLPYGSNAVRWTATDNLGATTSVTQTINVVDTTPPSSLTLSSATHPSGTVSRVPTVTVTSSASSDRCSLASGCSYSWSQDTTADPDTVVDASVSGATSITVTSTVESEWFPASTWPTDWTRSDATYVRTTNATGRTQGSYSGEVWANNNTRRTANFYKDFSLAGLTSASLTFWDVTEFAGTGDYSRVEYSTNGGTSYTQLQNLTGISAWTQRTYSLPVGGTVRVRFSASVAGANDHANWDDIFVFGTTTTSVPTVAVNSTQALADGVWYFNARAVDGVGNWTPTSSYGPITIDRTPPVTTSNAPSGWTSSTPVPVTLTATDALTSVAYTRYKLDTAAVATYTAPVAVSGEGTHTLQFFSADAAGNVEATKSAQVRIDTVKPSTPSTPWAAAATTTSVDVTSTPATDVTSGVAYYKFYRNGSLVGTASAPSYTDEGLTPGTSYGYTIRSVDYAGNESTMSATTTATCPPAGVWMSISESNVDFGVLVPGTPSTVPSATTVAVGSVGSILYDLTCSAVDFSMITTVTPAPTFPASSLEFATTGFKVIPLQPFSTSPSAIDSGIGQRYAWQHDYRFDYTLTIPWDAQAGTYQTSIVYTAVAR